MSPVVKKNQPKFHIESKYLLLILTVVCAGLIGLSFLAKVPGTFLNTIGGYIIVPFQKGISSCGMWLSDRSDEIAQIRDLIAQNEELQKQVDELTIENTQLQQDKYELYTLRELLELDSQYDDYEKVGARIISKETGNWYHTFVIDKGSKDGLSPDMNVIASGGLVGRISETGPHWSKVVSIIDDSSNVSGSVLTTQDNLIVSGDLELMENNQIAFSQLVDSANAVSVGDKVVTSNISDKYLPGILIGYIVSINNDTNNLTKSGTATPYVDFEHLQEVLVITRCKQNYLDEEGESADSGETVEGSQTETAETVDETETVEDGTNQ